MEQPVLRPLVPQPLPPSAVISAAPSGLPTCCPQSRPDADLPDPHTSRQRCSHETATDKTITRRNSSAPESAWGPPEPRSEGPTAVARCGSPGLLCAGCSPFLASCLGHFVRAWGHSALAWVRRAFVCSCGCWDRAEGAGGRGRVCVRRLVGRPSLPRLRESGSSRGLTGAQSP